jgi:isopenicillin-N N-acyltransferase like protein
MPADRHRTRRIIIVLLVLAVLVSGIAIYLRIITADRPPLVKDMSSLQLERKTYGSNIYFYGNNWLRKSRSGLWEAYIEGKPFERGVAFGRLTRELLYFQESVFVEEIRKMIPSDTYLKFLRHFISFFNRNLQKNIPYEYRQEIYGTSFSCSSEFDFIGSAYQRQLNYHAAHDIGHAIQQLHLVACTSFSVWDGNSSDSSLLIGRNFDFYMGDKFAENKIVCFVNPFEGYQFMTITWADMIGVVSGMNEKGLTVTINASKSIIPGQSATPATILAREILQYARSIEDAYDISKRFRLFISESIMVGSAFDSKTAIIEKTPEKTDLVFSPAENIICSNHFQGSVFATDKINLENIRKSDSYARYMRVEELVTRYEPFDLNKMVEVLRDQKVLGDANAGMGNQLAINQLICHHSVIFKPGSLQVWVSASPWQLGEFVAYDLKKVFQADTGKIKAGNEISEVGLSLPPDTFLYSHAYKSFLKYKEMTQQIKELIENREPLPEGFTDEYVSSNPELYLTYVNLGDYFTKIRNSRKANFFYASALQCKLPGLDEKEKILKLIKDNK